MSNFIVTCHGWSASNWIAHSLNMNKNIICTHSARNVIAQSINLQSNKNLKENINELHRGYLNRQNRSMDIIYDEIEGKGDAKYYGSVHVLRMRDLPVINEKFGASKRFFKVANIIRNPIDLVWSGYGQFKDLFRYDINELSWTTGKIVRQALEFVNYIGKKYDIFIGDFDNLAFIGACSILESLRFDIEAYPKVKRMENIEFVGTYKMEEITSDKKKFIDFFIGLGLNDILCDEYINEVFSTGIINKHKNDNKKITPLERYNEFLPWQKEVFNYFLTLNNIKYDYEKFGYDLAFINFAKD